MTIRRNQIQRIFADVARQLYSSGKAPTLGELMAKVQERLSQSPPGVPLSLPEVASSGERSDPDVYNELLENSSANFDVAYEVLLGQVQEVVEINNSLHASLESLRKRRKKLERRIDDYLLGLRNADGYFYSVSDNFTDLDDLNLDLTTAEVDTDAGSVMIPSNSHRTRRVDSSTYGRPLINITTEDGTRSYRELSSLSGATDDESDNSVWAFEVVVNDPQEVIAQVDIPLRDSNEDSPRVSSLQFSPYGMSPVQLTVSMGMGEDDLQLFGEKIKTSTGAMAFDAPSRESSLMRLRLRKEDYDYSDFRGGQTEYHYVFGARKLTLVQQSYERQATMITGLWEIPEDLRDSMVIDAVSLSADDERPMGTSIEYYVAAASEELEDYSNLNWHRIRPIGSANQSDQLVRFEGANERFRAIVDDPEQGEIQAIPLQASGPAADRNPSPAIIPGVDVYRIAEFEDGFLPSRMALIEGRNATRIHSTQLDSEAIEGLGFWKDLLDNDDPDLDFGRIDTGDGFFYGGDVGVGGRSVYVETFVHSPIRRDTILAEMQKVDDRSRMWEVRAFLNGSQVVHMPVGEHKRQVPWAFMEGPNHIALLVQIPDEEVAPEAYTGVLDLMAGRSLTEYGDVHLASWEYVDMFEMEYNESGNNPPKTFTVHEGEIISRRRPSTHTHLRYATATGNQPDGVVLRADLSRNRNAPAVSSKVNNYRLRFSYAQDR